MKNILGFAALWLVIIFTGCKSVVHPPPMVIQRHDLTNDIANYPKLKDAPIVDIHSHTFNARYLPLQNIAVARHYDIWGGIISFIPDPLVDWLAAWIVDGSKLADLDGEPGPFEPKGPPETKVAAIQMAAKNLRDEIAAALANAKAPRGARLKALSEVTELDRKRADQTARKLFGDVDPHDAEFKSKRRQDGDIPNGALYRFIYFLQRDEITSRDDLTGAEFPEVGLFVHHMMDLAPVYGQKPDGKRLLDFSTTQIERMRRLDQKSEGKFIHFVAFSPYRARTEQGIDFEAAWRPVQEALDNGAWGVKFYPPSGYRPAGNDIPSNCSLIPALRRQWRDRYDGWTDGELNKVMMQFFERCAEREIPVFTHSGYGEFQAAGGYGPRHANPKFWRQLFDQNPKLKEKLRLCFGHAGGEDYWYADGSYQLWGEEVVKLCIECTNVFCEFGASDGIVESGNQVMFANRMLEIIQKYPKFAERTMYGSDWFMPMDIKPRAAYLGAYRQIFLTKQLEDHYKDFFCRNAIRFLNMDDARIDRDPLLSPVAKAKVKALVHRAMK